MTSLVDISLDSVSLATAVPEALVMKVHRPLLGARRDTYVDVPGRESAWRFNEQPGDRTLTIDIDLQAGSFAARRAAVVALADWADTLAGTVKLIVSDQSDRYWDAAIVNAPDVDEVLIAGTCSLDYRVGPYCNSVTVSTETFSGGSAGHLAHTWTTVDDVFAYPIIELTPAGGNLDSPTVTLNGDSLSIIESTAAGQTLTINGITSVVLAGANDDENLTGAWNGDDLVMARVSGDFGVVLPGANAFAIDYDGSATSVAVVISWRRRYR